MSDIKEYGIEVMRSPPWWLHATGHGVLVALVYPLYIVAPHLGVLVLGGVSLALWYLCNEFYGYAMSLFNERALRDLLDNINGTFGEDKSLIDTPNVDGYDGKKSSKAGLQAGEEENNE